MLICDYRLFEMDNNVISINRVPQTNEYVVNSMEDSQTVCTDDWLMIYTHTVSLIFVLDLNVIVIGLERSLVKFITYEKPD